MTDLITMREAPAQEKNEITVGRLTEADVGQLWELENGYLNEIGEGQLTEDKKGRLTRAIADESIVFFMARRGCRAVGMCSVVTAFSTFCCEDVGTFEDFYIAPEFRKQGIARKLAGTAQRWCSERGVSSLSVTCAPCDEAMYRALGFDLRLGSTFAKIL